MAKPVPIIAHKAASKIMPKNNWLVYIILCSDESLYTGITTDVDKRFAQHKNKKGAKYFYGRHPEKIVYIEEGYDRSTASQREYELKQYSRIKKLSLCGLKIDGSKNLS